MSTDSLEVKEKEKDVQKKNIYKTALYFRMANSKLYTADETFSWRGKNNTAKHFIREVGFNISENVYLEQTSGLHYSGTWLLTQERLQKCCKIKGQENNSYFEAYLGCLGNDAGFQYGRGGATRIKYEQGAQIFTLSLRVFFASFKLCIRCLDETNREV